jgi:hypothetical protein
MSRSHRSSIGSYYPPDPVDAVERKSVLKGTAGYIIVTEFCERLAYYGFAGSLVLFFEVSRLLLFHVCFLRLYSLFEFLFLPVRLNSTIRWQKLMSSTVLGQGFVI